MHPDDDQVDPPEGWYRVEYGLVEEGDKIKLPGDSCSCWRDVNNTYFGSEANQWPNVIRKTKGVFALLAIKHEKEYCNGS